VVRRGKQCLLVILIIVEFLDRMLVRRVWFTDLNCMKESKQNIMVDEIFVM
jgi:hypothetical protein